MSYKTTFAEVKQHTDKLCNSCSLDHCVFRERHPKHPRCSSEYCNCDNYRAMWNMGLGVMELCGLERSGCGLATFARESMAMYACSAAW